MLKFDPGTTLWEAAEIMAHAQKLVVADFNGTPMLGGPGITARDIAERWSEIRREQQEGRCR